jgi:crotonobetainyl-CoA:carnitine CoA-transferase CaiB-like acyl-CoA transferase
LRRGATCVALSRDVRRPAHPARERRITPRCAGLIRPTRLIDGGREERALPAPTLGEHTDAVFGDLGYDAGRIATLRAAGVV